ncbi:MAG: transcription factor S [Desulfurococcaceae archaeon]
MVRFCPRCGSLLKPSRENGKIHLICSRCGYKIGPENSVQDSYRLSTRIAHSSKERTVVVNEIDTSNLPITKDVTCKRCGAHEAYYWMIQTRAADEPPTRFYKCVKCGYVWREYE